MGYMAEYGKTGKKPTHLEVNLGRGKKLVYFNTPQGIQAMTKDGKARKVKQGMTRIMRVRARGWVHYLQDPDEQERIFKRYCSDPKLKKDLAKVIDKESAEQFIKNKMIPKYDGLMALFRAETPEERRGLNAFIDFLLNKVKMDNLTHMKGLVEEFELKTKKVKGIKVTDEIILIPTKQGLRAFNKKRGKWASLPEDYLPTPEGYAGDEFKLFIPKTKKKKRRGVVTVIVGKDVYRYYIGDRHRSSTLLPFDRKRVLPARHVPKAVDLIKQFKKKKEKNLGSGGVLFGLWVKKKSKKPKKLLRKERGKFEIKRFSKSKKNRLKKKKR